MCPTPAHRASATSTPPLSADAHLLQALLVELAAHPGGVSTARLCKRLGLRMSVLLRILSWIGEDAIGGQPAHGWVRLAGDGSRTLVHLTDSGRALVASLQPRDGPG